jgi:hypothetical protein
MATFYTRNIPPLGVNREPLPPSSKLDISLKPKIYAVFKEELLRPKSPLNMIMMDIPGFDPFPVTLQRVGHTALIARWLLGLDTAAITLLLSDIDRTEDEQALQIVHVELCRDRDDVTSMIDKLIAMIQMEPRPLAATIHLVERTYDDQATRVSAHGLADAFFYQFGASSNDQT